MTTREGNELAVWFGSQVYNAATCDPSLVSVPAAFATVPGGDCLSGAGFRDRVPTAGCAGDQQRLGGQLAPRRDEHRPGRHAATIFARPGGGPLRQLLGRCRKIWDGYDAAGKRNVNLPDCQLHEPSGLAASRVNPDTVHVHSESDVEGMVAVDAGDARMVGSYDVAIPQRWDSEGIATGPCSER